MKVDGRKIDHAKLEEIRFAAVKAVQEGKTPSQTARDLGIEVKRVFEWLARYCAGMRCGLGRRAVGRRN